MKPIRLTLQAFGPYSGREVIDFRPALESGLFGVYGQTGSGKSTVFSAMTFALFGEPAKSEQDAASLRSDHADPSLCTEVEFVFDIGGKRYVILRRPDQMRPKQRGDGETKSPHEAHLFDASGIALERITSTDRGKIIAEKKVRDVDTAIVERLGYGKEQFRQIVLLPQGRFETFLAAKTKERMAILRDLFDVSLFQAFAADLKSQSEIAQQAFKSDREFCERILTNEGLADFAALAETIRQTTLERDQCVLAEAASKATHDKASIALQTAKSIIADYEAAEAAAASFQKLENQKPEIDALARRLAYLEAARGLRDLDDAKREAVVEVENLQNRLQRAAEALEASSLKARKAEDEWTGQAARRNAMEVAKNRLLQYQRFRENLDKASVAKDMLQRANDCLSQQKSKIAEAEQRLETIEQTIHSGIERLARARSDAQSRQTLSLEVSALRSALKDAQTYAERRDLVSKAREAEARCQAHAAAAKATFDLADKAFTNAEAVLANAQAMHLSQKLESGKPCPVCGSKEHPAPVLGEPATAGLDQTFRATRKAKDDSSSDLRLAELELARATASRQEREQQVAGLTMPEHDTAHWMQAIAQVEARLLALGPALDQAGIEAELDLKNQEKTEIIGQMEILRTESIQLINNSAVASATVEDYLSAVPSEFRSDDALALQTDNLLRNLRTQEDEIARIDNNRALSREDLIAAQSALQAAQDLLSASMSRQEKTQANFDTRLTEAGLTADAFETLKPEIDSIPAIRSRIDTFNQHHSIARNAMETTARAIADRPKPELDTINNNLAVSQSALDEATATKHRVNGQLTHLQTLHNRIAAIEKKLIDDEERTGPLRRLAALVNGDNDQKLELETFAIGAMFDQVLLAANQRLEPMTKGRFRLERSLEETGRGRRGLGIEAFDMFTGKSRPTASLSGGETFIAALALALGLADVVEAASGKVRLDTIFIDEGFGSLDTENGTGTLDQVLQVLNTLVSQNRSVGIISHVPLVQEVIPNGFYIRKGPDGSFVEERHGF